MRVLFRGGRGKLATGMFEWLNKGRRNGAGADGKTNPTEEAREARPAPPTIAFRCGKEKEIYRSGERGIHAGSVYHEVTPTALQTV